MTKRIVVLTSSRADYGIYRPLLKKLRDDAAFELTIVAFGTHLSRFHGYTIQQIQDDDFGKIETVESMLLTDSPEAVSTAMGLTTQKMAALWARLSTQTDLIICLGDRYEMLAAVLATVPFNLPVAHLHGGETTLGAIDDTFRHCLTLMATLHFTATPAYAQRVSQLKGAATNVHCVGALSLDNLLEMKLLSPIEFQEKFGIDLSIPTILTTFHPETVAVEANEKHALEVSKALQELAKTRQVLITMPNADTAGTLIRQAFQELAARNRNVILVENLGSLGYFSAMKHCAFLLGNSSSGIIEAASLGKFAINLGQRQAGRARSQNVLDVAIEADAIEAAVRQIDQQPVFTGINVYQANHSAADSIIKILKQMEVTSVKEKQ